MQVLTDHLTLALHKDKILVVNLREVAIKQLVYCSWEEVYVQTDGEGQRLFMIQSAPFYRLSNIDANAYSILENTDQFGEGKTKYKLVRLDWEDGEFIENLVWSSPIDSWDKLPELSYSDIPKRFLKNERPVKGLKTAEECEQFAQSLSE